MQRLYSWTRSVLRKQKHVIVIECQHLGSCSQSTGVLSDLALLQEYAIGLCSRSGFSLLPSARLCLLLAMIAVVLEPRPLGKSLN